MSGLNKAMLIGRLGRDPETRRTNAGDSVVTFSIATSESWKDKATGERKERTEWHNVVIFNENLGKIAEQFLRKGSQVYVEGEIRTRTYQDRDNVERKTTEIVLSQFKGAITLIGGGDNARPAAAQESYGTVKARPGQAASSPPRPMADVIDDDIPF